MEITTEDGVIFYVLCPIRRDLAMPLCAVAPCHGRHADKLSAPLSVVGHESSEFERRSNDE